jgi:hypothetical protein
MSFTSLGQATFSKSSGMTMVSPGSISFSSSSKAKTSHLLLKGFQPKKFFDNFLAVPSTFRT